MNNQIRPCGHHNPSFLITYKIGSKYHVCDPCSKLDSWSRGIKEKIQISEIDGQERPQSISEQELIDNG